MGFLIKYFRELLLVVLCIMFVASCELNQHLKNVNDILLTQKDSAFNQVKTYVDKNGKLVNQVQAHELTIKELKETGNALGFDNKNLKAQVGSLKNLVGYWKVQAKLSGTDSIRFKDSVRYVFVDQDSIHALDTIQYKTFGWSNGYLTIKEDYYPYDNLVSLEYEYDFGGIELTAYRKKQSVAGKLFKKKVLVADVKFGDPNLKTSEIKALSIKESDRKFYQKGWFWALVSFGLGAGLR